MIINYRFIFYILYSNKNKAYHIFYKVWTKGRFMIKIVMSDFSYSEFDTLI